MSERPRLRPSTKALIHQHHSGQEDPELATILLSLETILYVNHVISNEKIIFLPQSYFIRSKHILRVLQMGPALMGDPSKSLLKDRGSPMLDVRIQPTMGYTLMAA